MNTDTSEEISAGRGRQVVMSVQADRASPSRQDALADESLGAMQGYDGFDDLTLEDAGSAGE